MNVKNLVLLKMYFLLLGLTKVKIGVGCRVRHRRCLIMIEIWLWVGVYLVALGIVLLMPSAFAPCTYPSFGKNVAVVGAIIGTIGGLMVIVSVTPH